MYDDIQAPGRFNAPLKRSLRLALTVTPYLHFTEHSPPGFQNVNVRAALHPGGGYALHAADSPAVSQYVCDLTPLVDHPALRVDPLRVPSVRLAIVNDKTC